MTTMRALVAHAVGEPAAVLCLRDILDVIAPARLVRGPVSE